MKYLFLFIIPFIAPNITKAQNLALTATAAHSGGGQTAFGYGPELYNNDAIPTYLQAGTFLWGWVSSNGWIEYTWSSPQNIDSVCFHNGGSSTSRHFTSGIAQYWNGTAYVTIGNITGQPVSIVGYRLPSTVNTTKLRFSSLTGSNPAFREIQVYGPSNCNGTPNSGIVQIASSNITCGDTIGVTLAGHTVGYNVSYQWQMNTGSGWSNFGTSSPSLTTPALTQATTIRCQVTCNATNGGTATTLPVSVNTSNIAIDLGNDTTICDGITQTLDAGVSNASYEWSNNTTTQTTNISSPNTYWVQVTETNGCMGSDTIEVSNGIEPTNFLDSSYTLCTDSLLILDAGNDSTSFSYQWAPTNETTRSITVITAGTYNVTITSEDNCAITSTTQAISRPRPVPNLPDEEYICSTDSVLLDATATNGANYFWNTGATTPSIYASDSITYNVKVQSQYGCWGYDSTLVIYYPDPTTEGFSFIPYFYDELGKVSFQAINPQTVNSYKWYFGDGDSSTLERPTHTYDNIGTYQVTLIVYNGCSENTYTQVLEIDNGTTSISTVSNSAPIQIYPNPAHKYITVKSADNQAIQPITIYNSVGAIVYSGVTNNTQSTIDLEHLANGLYQIKITNEDNQVYIKKLIIANP